MDMTRKKNFITTVLYAVLLAAIVFVAFKYVIPLIFPFLISFVIAALVRPLVNLLHRKLHIAKRLSAVVLVTLIYLILAGLLILIGSELYQAAGNAVGWFNQSFVPDVRSLFGRVGEWLSDSVDAEVLTFLTSMQDGLLSSIGSSITSFSTNLLSSVVGSLPSLLLQIIFAVVATYLMSIDADLILHAIASRMEEARYEKIRTSYHTLKSTILKFLRAYSLILLITFGELVLGLFCAGVENFWLFAALIAVFDILPVVGSGMIMLPWSVITLIRGNYQQGIILFVVYLVVVLARQFMEPKIVGDQVGLHPLITLIAMYVGMKLFGGIGLLGLPILCALLVQLEASGIICLFPNRREIPFMEKKRKPLFSKKAKK